MPYFRLAAIALTMGLSMPTLAVTYNYRYAIPGMSASAPAPAPAPVVTYALASFGAYTAWEDGTYAGSCKEYRNPTGNRAYTGATGDGIYRLSVNGNIFDAYCDMTSEGGGWTKVVQQYEATPVGWNGVVNGNSFSLAANRIPAHSQVAFGKDNVATFVDYVNWTYTTGAIASVRVTSPKTGFSYDIFRSPSGYYDFANPEETYLPYADQWSNSLTFDKTGGRGLTWTFSPGGSTAPSRGTFMAGANLVSSSESYAWTVWVR